MRSPAWMNGQWIRAQDALLPLDDLGVLQAASVVERLRTYNGKLVDLSRHIARFREGLASVGISLPESWDVESLVPQCLDRQAHKQEKGQADGEDFSIVVMGTPGRVGTSEPTLVVHASDLPWRRLASWYRCGQVLMGSSHQSVPEACWPAKLKTRSRLHYYLADQSAIEEATAKRMDGAEFAAGVLVDQSGHLTETSMANIAILEGDRLVTPLAAGILTGTSQPRVLDAARNVGLQVDSEPITPQRAMAADQVWLTGALGCLWAAQSFGSALYDAPADCQAFRLVQGYVMKAVGIDYVQQATRLG